jgi:hypothetical protein
MHRLLVRPRAASYAAAVLALLLPCSSPVAAQSVQRLLPNRDLLPKLLAAPREPTTAAKLVLPLTSPSQFGTVLEGDAAFGASLPVYLVAGRSSENALVIGVEGGVFARFNLLTKERDLITSDWVFAVPLVLRRGGQWLSVRYFHSSAHLGDEYLERFDVERIPYSRDAFEVTAYWRPRGALGVYGGARWAFRVDPPEHRRWAVRGGLEIQGAGEARTQPYLAADVELDQQNRWEPRLNAQAGVRIAPNLSRPAVRVGVEFLTGPSPQGQFWDRRATHFALGITLDL